MLVDTAFSLHVSAQAGPVYISEVVPSTINPEFQEMDLVESKWRNAQQLFLRVWGWDGSQWHCAVHESVELASLVFVGKTTDTIVAPFPPNTVILYLQDGCYVLPRTAARAGLDSAGTGYASRDEALTTTSASYDAMMKITNLHEFIYDAHRTRDQVAGEIAARLGGASRGASHGGANTDDGVPDPLDTKNAGQKPPAYFLAVRQRALLEGELAQARTGLASEQRRTEQTRKQIAEARARIETRRKRMAAARDQCAAILDSARSGRTQSESRRAELDEMSRELAQLRGVAAQQLLEIFAIEPVEGRTLEFTINGLELVEPTTGPHDEDVLGAAYGMTTQLVDVLSRLLGVPLRYPVQPYGSQSFVVDPISDIDGSRTFPLWSKGSLFYRFEYGVFLLQKDVEQLVNSQGMRIVDLKLLLANLKSLLLVLGTRKDQ